MHSIESRCVIGPKNILFAGASVHLSAQKIVQARAVKGLITNSQFTSPVDSDHYQHIIMSYYEKKL